MENPPSNAASSSRAGRYGKQRTDYRAKMLCRSFYLVLVLALASIAQLQAAVLVTYDMQNLVDALKITPSGTNAFVTATDLSISPGPSIVYNGPEFLAGGDITDYYTVWSPTLSGGTNALQALANGNYFYLTVTPDAGKQISIA